MAAPRRAPFLALVPLAAAIALPAASPGAPPYLPCKKPRPPATTPTKPGAHGAAVQWAFRAARSGPGGGRADVTSGHGGYSSPSSISGSVCRNDSVAGGSRITMKAVPGSSARLERGATRGGSNGAELVLPVRVSASDDPTCRVGARGTLTLFTSYDSAHTDSVTLRLAGACARHNASDRGSNVVVAIPH